MRLKAYATLRIFGFRQAVPAAKVQGMARMAASSPISAHLNPIACGVTSLPCGLRKEAVYRAAKGWQRLAATVD